MTARVRGKMSQVWQNPASGLQFPLSDNVCLGWWQTSFVFISIKKKYGSTYRISQGTVDDIHQVPILYSTLERLHITTEHKCTLAVVSFSLLFCLVHRECWECLIWLY